jgi:hypothetical protein
MWLQYQMSKSLLHFATSISAVKFLGVCSWWRDGEKGIVVQDKGGGNEGKANTILIMYN